MKAPKVRKADLVTGQGALEGGRMTHVAVWPKGARQSPSGVARSSAGNFPVPTTSSFKHPLIFNNELTSAKLFNCLVAKSDSTSSKREMVISKALLMQARKRPRFLRDLPNIHF